MSSTDSSTLASNRVHEKTELQTHEKLERKNVALKALAPQHYITNSDRNEIHWQGGLQGPRTPVASELEHIKCRVGNRVEGHLYQANKSCSSRTRVHLSSTDSNTLASHSVHEKTELQTHEKLERENKGHPCPAKNGSLSSNALEA